ncbi:MAG: Gfo/Idh/MocA family oxidoreductase [Phycisphaerales bacterium]|nr:Gfo/Idh/MocA family oxidoreductase [Phycisphaerales bacterium]
MTTPTPSPSDRPLRCAVVGVGRMGQHHARVYASTPGVTLVGVVDASEARRNEIAAKHDTRAFAAVSDLLAAGVDAVTVAVPTVAHLESTAPLLEAKIACLIEKPLAATAAQAEQMREMASRSGAVLQVGHIERFNPAVMALSRERARLGPGALAPRFIEIHRVSPMSFRSTDVGVVLDMMIHDLDVVLMLMEGSEPTEISASAVAVIGEHEDVCNARLVFDRPQGRCVANITASRLAMKTERKMRIVCEDGYVSIDYAQKNGMLIRKTANEAQLAEVRRKIAEGADLSSLNYSELVEMEPLQVDDADQLRMQIADFLGAVRSGRPPSVDARAGFVNVRTANRIVEAARAGS